MPPSIRRQNIPPPPHWDGISPWTANGTIGANGNVDIYRLQLPNGNFTGGINVTLDTNGLSLLTGGLSVYDSNYNLIGTASEVDPLSSNPVIHLSNVQGNSTYYIKVQGNSSDVFGVGSYQVQVSMPPQTNGGPMNLLQSYNPQDIHLPGNYTGATPLLLKSSITQQNEIDVYRLQTNNINTSNGMVVMLAAIGQSIAAPSLSVYDNNGNLLNAVSTVDPNTGVLTIAVPNVTANHHNIIVQTGIQSLLGHGTYQLGIDFRSYAAVIAGTPCCPIGAEQRIGWRRETGDIDFTNGTYIVQQLPPPCSQQGHAPCIPGNGTLPAHVVLSSNRKILQNINNWGPRIGLAYRLGDKTALRQASGSFMITGPRLLKLRKTTSANGRMWLRTYCRT